MAMCWTSSRLICSRQKSRSRQIDESGTQLLRSLRQCFKNIAKFSLGGVRALLVVQPLKDFAKFGFVRAESSRLTWADVRTAEHAVALLALPSALVLLKKYV